MDLQAWIAGLGEMTRRDVDEEIGLARGWLEKYQTELAAAYSPAQIALKTELIAVQQERLAYLRAL